MTRKHCVRLALLSVFGLSMVVSLVIPKIASAGPGGRDNQRGYFTNALAPSYGRSVIVGGIPSSIWRYSNGDTIEDQDVRRQRFINFINDNLDE